MEAAKALHARAGAAQPLHQDPRHPRGPAGHRGGIAAGVPVNVTLLFSADQYLAAAEAYLRGVERRVAAGLDPAVGSVASVFMSRWDTAVAKQVPAELQDKLGPRGRASTSTAPTGS